MKKVTYKVYTPRQYGGRFFAPQSSTALVINRSAGKVDINNVTYLTTTNTDKIYLQHCKIR
ncbi:MAG: hypothetical protein IPP96_17340 [Chitinophagaceae bacterium]|nr:hypothetical protein [Chitinophagaceae bacterium]